MTIQPVSAGWILALIVFILCVVLTLIGHLAPLLALLIGMVALSRLI